MNSAGSKWVAQSRYDLETARAMQASGRWLYVLFCCQQSVEKALKALFVAQSAEFPPRIHNLLRLAEFSSVHLSAEQADFLGELSAYYIQTRYPEEIDELSRSMTCEIASSTLAKTEEIIEWLFLRES